MWHGRQITYIGLHVQTEYIVQRYNFRMAAISALSAQAARSGGMHTL